MSIETNSRRSFARGAWIAVVLLVLAAGPVACGPDDAADGSSGTMASPADQPAGGPEADGADDEPAPGASRAELVALENDLEIREAELAEAKERIEELRAEKAALADDVAQAAQELEAQRDRADRLARELKSRRSMLESSDEAVLRARRELEEAQARLKETQSKYGLERSRLLEKIEELQARVDELDPEAVKAKVRSLERTGYHKCGVVMRKEESRYGTHLTIRTSVDAARIGGEGLLRSPDGKILAVVEFVIGRDDALSAKVLFQREDARLEVGDYVFSRLR